MAYTKDTNWDNEKKYLDNLSKNGDAGQKAWAENQKKVLASAQAQYSSSSSGNSSSLSTGTTSSSSSKGTSSSSKGTTNSQYTGSANDIVTTNSTQQAIKDKMNANSLAWWSADEDGRRNLEDENKYLSSLLSGTVSFDPYTGYWSGTADGATDTTSGITLDDILNWGGNYDKKNARPTQQARDPRIDTLLNEILNRDDFSYNAQSDPLYAQYAKMYQREGDRAMKETMAEAAAGAGGMNSYAITAAQQAANNYAAQLGDKIPELYQLAYEMYLADKESKVQDLGILQQMDDTQYNRYRDTMNDWYKDKNFAYGLYQDAVQQGNWLSNFGYNSMIDNRNFLFDSYWKNMDFITNQGQQNLENSWYGTEYSDKKALQEREEAKERIRNIIANNGTPPPELIESAGLTQYEVDLMIAAKEAEENKKKTGEEYEEEEYEEEESDVMPDPVKPDYIDEDLWEKTLPYEKGSENYQSVDETCAELFASGGWAAVQPALNEAREKEIIDQSSYMRLFNKYRDMK